MTKLTPRIPMQRRYMLWIRDVDKRPIQSIMEHMESDGLNDDVTISDAIRFAIHHLYIHHLTEETRWTDQSGSE